MVLWADNAADYDCDLELVVTSDESSDTPWATIPLAAIFSESEPALYFTPDHVETGVAQDDMVTETVTLSNQGLADLTDVNLTLIDASGDAAPDWVRLNTPSDIGTIAVDETRNVSVSFLSPADEPQGMQIFYIRVTSSNYPVTDIGLYPTITSSGIGSILFKVSDIYTGTFNAKNELIQGLSGAKIKLQNEETLTSYTVTTDAYGEAQLEDLPTGAYKCRVTASNHQETTCRVWVKPGITVSKETFLEYNLVTVEWEVNEITIEDKYEILLTATYETDVPAAVVVASPLSVTLPDMEKGDVYLGEFTLVNHGLVRADDLSIPVPESDAHFQYEILTGLPTSLDAKSRITIPYRVTCLKSLDNDEEDDTGGGCYTYQKCISIPYEYECANGQTTSGSTRHCFYKSGGTCGGTSSGSSSSTAVISVGSSSGTTSGTAPAATAMDSDQQKCLPKVDPKECKGCEPMAVFQNQSIIVGSEIHLLMREFRDEVTDLSVKVPAGRLALTRRYRSGAWQWDELNPVIDGRTDDASVYASSDYGPDYVTRGDVPYERTAKGVYTSETYTITRKGDTVEHLDDKYTFKDKAGNWVIYDSLGRPMSRGSRNGTLAQYIYDSDTDTDPSGLADNDGTQVLWLEYDSDGNLARVYDADALQVTYEYADGLLTRATDVLGNAVDYEYSGGSLVKKTNAEGFGITIAYNGSDDPVKVTDSRGAVHTFEYDYDKNKKIYYAMAKTPAGVVKEVWYSAEGKTGRADLNGTTVQEIEEDGRTYTITDRKGNETVKTYDENENLKKVVHADGTRILYQYNLDLNKITSK